MSSPVVPPTNVVTASVQPSASDPTTAAGAVTSNYQEVTSETKIGTLEDLKKKSPELYQKMMQGIATNMIHESQKHTDHLKELMRKGTQDAAGG